MREPTIEELECLNGWPQSTVGHDLEQLLITQLHELCTTFGVHRVRQMMRGVHEIYHHPTKLAQYQQLKQQLHPLTTTTEPRPTQEIQEHYG